jgi:hypothetical protein
MSDKDPQSTKPAGQANPSQPNLPPGAVAKPAVSTKTARKGATAVVLVALALVAVVLTVVGGAVWYWMNLRTSPPVASASPEVEEDFVVESEPAEDTLAEAAPDAEVVAEPETEPATVPAAPTTGTLEIRSDVAGADVFLNGKRVGTTPYKASDLTPGKYSVKVEKAGYTSFEKRVDLGTKQQVVRAKLVAALATLRVEANVAGAKVSLDGEDRGTTPLDLSNVSPGRHVLAVSADGYETRTETLEVGSGKRDIKIDLVSPLATLNEAVAVKHKHRIGIGSCEGVLRASAEKLEYDSPHKDAFSVALSEVESLSLGKEDLSVKVRDGRSYKFNERNDNPAALASFHERVAPSLAK